MALHEILYLLFNIALLVGTTWWFHRIGKESGQAIALVRADTIAAEVRKVAEPAQPTPTAPLVADLLVLFWKIARKLKTGSAQGVERHCEKAIDRAAKAGFTLNEYRGQKIYVGSRVNIVDHVNGPQDQVLEDLEPEVLHNGTLLKEGSVIVGKTPTPIPANENV
jgi:hypothetical protein